MFIFPTHNNIHFSYSLVACLVALCIRYVNWYFYYWIFVSQNTKKLPKGNWILWATFMNILCVYRNTLTEITKIKTSSGVPFNFFYIMLYKQFNVKHDGLLNSKSNHQLNEMILQFYNSRLWILLCQKWISLLLFKEINKIVHHLRHWMNETKIEYCFLVFIQDMKRNENEIHSEECLDNKNFIYLEWCLFFFSYYYLCVFQEGNVWLSSIYKNWN